VRYGEDPEYPWWLMSGIWRAVKYECYVVVSGAILRETRLEPYAGPVYSRNQKNPYRKVVPVSHTEAWHRSRSSGSSRSPSNIIHEKRGCPPSLL